MKLFSLMFRRLTGYLNNPKVITESMEEYDWMTSGNADPTCISPKYTGGRLGVVPKKYEGLLRDKFRATQDEQGHWVVPMDLEWKEYKLLQPLWIKTPKDLIASKTATRLTPNGDPITNYVLPEEFGKGGEPTALSLLFASLPVFTSLLLLAHHISTHVAGWLGWGVSIVPLVGILAGLVAIEETFGIAKAVKALLLGVVLPYAMLELWPQGASLPNLAQWEPAKLALLLAVGVGAILMFWISWMVGPGKGRTRNGTGNHWHRGLDGMKSLLWWLLIFGGLDLAIKHLPVMFHAAIWFIPGCLMAVRHADNLWRWRGEMLLEAEMSGKLMSTMKSFNPDGPVLGVHRQQIIKAALDTSPMIYYGHGTGSLLIQYQSPLFMSAGQPVGLSVQDQALHFMGLGETGSGKTTSLARTDLYQWIVQGCGGALVECGKGQLPFDLQDLIDIQLRPGFNWALIEGMDGIQLGAALRAFKPSGKAVKDSDETGSNSHWNEGANLVIKHVVYLYYQLHRHEIAVRAAARVRAAKLAVKILTLDIKAMNGLDTTDIRGKAVATRDDCLEELAKKRAYRWTYGGVWRTANACNEVIHQPNNVKYIGKELTAMKGYLGITTGQTTLTETEAERIAREEPEKIHAEAQQMGSTLLEALDYIDRSYVGLADDTRTSFWGNIAQMFSPLMSTGTRYCNEAGVPWVEIEQGETLSGVFQGKTAGVFLNTDQDGPAALIVNQLARFFVYSGLRRRTDNWAQDPTQRKVKIMIDECHMLIGQAETDLITTLRSKGGTFFFLTQGIGQLMSTAGFSLEDAHALLDQFANICAMKVDQSTVEYLANRRVPMVWVTSGTQMKYINGGLIDVESAVDQLANSPLERKDLEHHSHYQKMERAGFGSIVLEGTPEQIKSRQNLKNMGFTDTYVGAYKTINAAGGNTMLDENDRPVAEKLVPAITADQIRGALITKGDGTALWLGHRAGAPRIDIVKLTGMSVQDVRKAIAARNPHTA